MKRSLVAGSGVALALFAVFVMFANAESGTDTGKPQLVDPAGRFEIAVRTDEVFVVDTRNGDVYRHSWQGTDGWRFFGNPIQMAEARAQKRAAEERAAKEKATTDKALDQVLKDSKRGG